MYVVTFYSFKGGVGRSMALANVALELAQTGRRVLIVDFDLEAPGLDTLALPRAKASVPGIVEFVTGYLASGVAPDVAEHVFEAEGVGRDGGKLWIMPSGVPDDSFSSRLNSINWVDLYANHEGYLLFEDLKAQWRETLAPDYVFIDSRTGHTDVGGICTRQLPDAVAILFIPNEQNRRGLEKVVRDIRSEKDGARRKNIALHFVMSNVPDIDDEDEILATRLRQFSRDLHIEHALTTIHRYDSLLLLNQAIFTRDKPRSRLAREYRELADRIASANSEDRAAALNFLRTEARGTRLAPVEFADRLDRIREKNAGDPEVLFELARAQLRQRRIPESLELLDETVRAGMTTPQVLMARGEARLILGDAPSAVIDALAVLRDVRTNFAELDRGIRLLRQAAPDKLLGLTDFGAVTNLSPDERRYLATQLRRSRIELRESYKISEALAEDQALASESRLRSRGDLAFALIGLAEFAQAMDVLGKLKAEAGAFSVSDAFNYAIAEWGVGGSPSRSSFQGVIELGSAVHETGANYLQCMALSHWAAGMTDEALALLDRARSRAISRPTSEASCWRYLVVSNEEFLRDLAAMASFVKDPRNAGPEVLLVGTAGAR